MDIPDADLIKAIATAIHSERCQSEWCSLPFGYEDEKAAQVAVETLANHALPGLYVTRHNGDLTVWRENPDHPERPTALDALRVTMVLAALLPDRTDEED